MGLPLKVCWILLLGVTLGLCDVTKENMKVEMREETTPALISHDLYNVNKFAHETIMDEIIDEELSDNTSSIVLKYISKQHDDYLYHGYMSIYKTILKNGLGDYVLVDLAVHISGSKLRGNVLSLLNLFPRSLKALISGLDVCVKNRGYAEHFYAAANDLKYDSERRNVYTWVPLGEAGRQGDWKFFHLQGNEFHIFNSHFKEFLVAEVGSFNYNEDRRRIFTKSRKDLLQGDVWAFEFKGNDVFIRNVLYNEYIYSLDPANSDKERRQVLAWIPEDRETCDSPTYQCRWSLSVC